MDKQSQVKMRQRRAKQLKDTAVTSSAAAAERENTFSVLSSQQNVHKIGEQTNPPEGKGQGQLEHKNDDPEMIQGGSNKDCSSPISSLLALEKLSLDDGDNNEELLVKGGQQFVVQGNVKKLGQKVEQKEVKVAGLPNVGNTCYINSIVQCLKSATDFANYVMSREWTSSLTTVRVGFSKLTIKEGNVEPDLFERQVEFLEQFSKLVQKMSVTEQSGGGVIEPEKFLTACHRLNKEFANGHQHDAVQFLDETLESIDTILQKENGADYFQKLFMGSHNSVLIDQESGQRRSKKEDFFCLRLPIAKPPSQNLVAKNEQDEPGLLPVSRKRRGRRFVTFQECIEEYLREERLVADADDPKENKKSCQKKKLELVHLPKYLFVQFKRLGFDKQTFQPCKDNTQVKFDLVNIDLSLYVVDTEGNQNVDKFVYDVIGVVHHYGQAYGGHYKAFRKSNGKWMKCSDDVVRECLNEEAISIQNAYVLLLEKRNFS